MCSNVKNIEIIPILIIGKYAQKKVFIIIFITCVREGDGEK